MIVSKVFESFINDNLLSIWKHLVCFPMPNMDFITRDLLLTSWHCFLIAYIVLWTVLVKLDIRKLLTRFGILISLTEILWCYSPYFWYNQIVLRWS